MPWKTYFVTVKRFFEISQKFKLKFWKFKSRYNGKISKSKRVLSLLQKNNIDKAVYSFQTNLSLCEHKSEFSHAHAKRKKKKNSYYYGKKSTHLKCLLNVMDRTIAFKIWSIAFQMTRVCMTYREINSKSIKCNFQFTDI